MGNPPEYLYNQKHDLTLKEVKMPRIVVNNKVYNSPDEMPPDVRATYLKTLEILHDSDGNGIPDFLEGKAPGSVSNGQIRVDVQSGSQYIVGDKIFTSLDDLPPDARLRYDQAIARLGPLMSDVNGNGIPDMLEGKPVRPPARPETPPADYPDIHRATSQEPPSSVIQEDVSLFGARALILLGLLFLMGLMGLGVYVYLTMVK